MTATPSSRSEASGRYFADRLITRLALNNRPQATARVARFLLKRMCAGGTVPSSTEHPKRVLVLPRRGFTDDILAALSDVPSLEIFALKRRSLKAIAEAFLPPEIDDNNYVATSPLAKAAMAAYRSFLVQFWRTFDQDRRINAVLTGNFGYYAEQELAAALESIGVPFIALHKENSWSPGNQSFWETVYRERRGPFMGRRILVYSPIERDLQIRSGIVAHGRIEVVGMPRLDVVHHWRESNAGLTTQGTVLFASFLPEVGMPVLGKATVANRSTDEPSGGGQTRTINLATLCKSAHLAIMRLAIENPSIRVLIKTKGRTRDKVALPGLLGLTHESELPANMRVVHGGPPLPLIAEASVVCGLHSTLLLEALAAGRPVIVPWYAEALDPEVRRYLFDLGSAVTAASTAAEFVSLLRTRALTTTRVSGELPLGTAKFLREWLGNDDGKAGQRAASAILRTIDHSLNPLPVSSTRGA
jgi:hypothetical protein